jgi:CheY-like chemotaxis protein
MAINRLGPRSGRVYSVLRERILEGELTPGTKLPPHTELAAEFGVAPLTLRHVLASLEEEGLVSREQGRGTFVRARSAPGVLIVDDDPLMRGLLRERVSRAGYRAVEADGPSTGLAALEQDANVALVLSDIRMPASSDGIGFIRAVRRRWPVLPLAAVTGYPGDLDLLHGTPECPVLILPKPFRVGQIDEVLRLALRPGVLTAAGSRR